MCTEVNTPQTKHTNINLHLLDLLPLFHKGDNWDSPFTFLNTKVHLERGLFNKGKSLFPEGANSFLFRIDSILAGRQNHFDRFASPESVSIPLKNVILYKLASEHMLTVSLHLYTVNVLKFSMFFS